MRVSAFIKTFRRVYPYIRQERFLFIFGLLSMFFVAGAGIADPLIIAHIIDKSIPAGNTRDLFFYAGIFVALILAGGILTYFQTILFARLGIRVVTRIKSDLFCHMLRLPVSYFDKHGVGKLIARVENDGENVKQMFSSFSIMIFGNILFFLGMIGVLLYKNMFITLMILIPIPFIFVLTLFMLNYLRKTYKLIRELFSELSNVITEYIQGINVLQMFNRESFAEEIVDGKSRSSIRAGMKVAAMEYSFWSFYGFLVETLFLIIVISLSAPRIIAGSITIGTLIIFIQYGRRIFEPLIQLSENMNFIQRAFVSLQRMLNILAEGEESPDSPDEGGEIVFKNSIEFKNVCFSYKPEEKVLKNVSFTINRGEKVALVGASGSGKTTTVSLLCGFYKVTEGNIFIDGESINSLNLYKWRKKIGLVLQDMFLFPGDILENVRIYDDSISESQVKDALIRTKADAFVNSLPEKEKTELSERGQNISSGEKQLLSFARAVAFSPEIVILDEATSSVDARTERKIREAMDEVLKGKTSVVVAHRLSTVINSDKILLFQDGRIIAEGTHDELLKTNTEYAELVRLQFLTKEDEG